MARIKYYDKEKSKWEYADLGGSGISEGKWELIETIDLKTDSKIVRTKENDGTDYNFLKIGWKIILPDSGTEYEGTIAAIDKINHTITNQYYSNKYFKGKGSYLTVEAINGKWETREAGWESNLLKSPIISGDKYTYKFQNNFNSNVAKIATSNLLPANTHLEIWAVRA